MSQSVINFQPYLKSIATTYEKWWEYYTLTDAEGKQRQAQKSSPLFDFGLTVQTVPKEARELQREEPQEKEKQAKEKIERFSVLEGLRTYVDRHRQVLLVGRPGSGKSTALARLMLEAASSQKSQVLKTCDFSTRIPVLVELRYWQGSIEQLILNACNRHGLSVTTNQLEQVLATAPLLFDGVNELPSEDARTQLAAFRYHHPNVAMIFTTRDLSLGGDLGIEHRLEMQPLTEPQMQAFIRAYIPEQAEAMLGQLKDRLREFGQTPLLLWMLCEVFQQAPDNQLPSNLGGVFQAFTKMYEESSVRKHEVALLKGDVRPLSDRRLWKAALKALASIMMQGKTPVDFRVAIHRDEAERELSRIFPNEKFPVRDILDDLLKYHLLQNRSTDQIEFRHQLIQEYYAAEWLLARLETLDGSTLQRDYLNYLKWTEPVALMLALVTDESLAVRVVQQALAVDWMLGARLAGEVKPEFQGQTVGLLNRLIEQNNLPEWLRVELWGRARSRVATPLLLQALSNPNIDIAQQAAFFIGETTNQTAIDLLTQRLEEIDSNFFAQASFGGHDPTGRLWTKHIEALAYLSPQTAIRFLCNKLIDPVEKRQTFVIHLCTEAPQLLMQLDGESILPRLIEKLYDTQSESQEQNNPFGWELTPRHIEQIKESAIKNQKSQILNLISHANNYESIIPDLIKVLKQEKIISIQTRIIQLIGQSNNELVNQALVELLSHEDFKVREESGIQLIKRKIDETGDIEKLLDHENCYVAWSAAVVLGCLGQTSALRTLSDVTRYYLTLDTEEDELTEGQLRIATKEELRVAKQEFKQQEIRLMATEVLGSIDHEESVSCLFNILRTDESEYVRREAVFSLSNLGKQEVIPGLLDALDKGIDARRNSIKGLIKLGVEEPLWNILQEKSAGWQAAAVELSKLGKIAVLPYLCQALADLGFESSNEMIQLLAKFADPETCHWLVDALDNPEPHQADQYFCNRIAFVLIECRPEVVESCLPALKEIISRSYVHQILWLIPAIQANCKFYNYSIQSEKLEMQNEAQGLLSSQSTQSQPSQPSAAPGNTIHVAGDYIAGDKIQGDKIAGNKTQHQFPNATEVKIFESQNL